MAYDQVNTIKDGGVRCDRHGAGSRPQPRSPAGHRLGVRRWVYPRRCGGFRVDGAQRTGGEVGVAQQFPGGGAPVPVGRDVECDGEGADRRLWPVAGQQGVVGMVAGQDVLVGDARVAQQFSGWGRAAGRERGGSRARRAAG